ncbi:MAG: dihydroorotate dehydrogenase electron transfer subunit [Candidatus Eisenbacteria sp.]|nr:dihydroorotate dehydrogenase electron transfer subunit [Candidatus Eisenbacteria bacterium]
MSARTGGSHAPKGCAGGQISIAAAEVVSNQQVARDLYWLSLALPETWGPPVPGQFVSLTLEPPWEETRSGDAGSALLRRPFSLAGFCKKGGRAVAEILYARVGKVTGLISGLRAGQMVDLLGPTGTGFPIAQDAHAVLVGGGHGIAPLLFVADVIRERKLPFTLLYGTRSADQAAPLDAFAGSVRWATEDGSRGTQGTVIDVLDQLTLEQRSVVMTCGPRAMLEAVAHWSGKRGLECWVSLEEIFGCGVGICASCAVPARGGAGAYERFLWACRDGPVVPAERVDWDAWRPVKA